MSGAKSRALEEMPPQSRFSELLGIEILTCTPAEVICRMEVTEAMANRNGVLHGGALMTLSDTAAGTSAFINSVADMSNTTVEAKTNFIRPVRVGDVLTACCVPTHVGRTTQVLQVTMTRGDGKVAGVTTQTHLLLGWKG
nr:PaaI family thioesterase [uncultured Celeribacter sp.]